MRRKLKKSVPDPQSAKVAYPKPIREAKTKHGRRPRELGRMAFYSNLWCILRDLAQGGNIEPDLIEVASDCGRGAWGTIEVAHLGDRGAKGTGGWRRAPDKLTAPLCRKHHRAIDGTVGGRAPWYVSRGREWQQELRAKLVRFASYYWDGLAPHVRAEWDRKAAEQRLAARARRA